MPDGDRFSYVYTKYFTFSFHQIFWIDIFLEIFEIQFLCLFSKTLYNNLDILLYLRKIIELRMVRVSDKFLGQVS